LRNISGSKKGIFFPNIIGIIIEIDSITSVLQNNLGEHGNLCIPRKTMSDGIEKIRTLELEEIIGRRGDKRSGISSNDPGNRRDSSISCCIKWSPESEIISESPMSLTGIDRLICGAEVESKLTTSMPNRYTLSYRIIGTGITCAESGIDSSGQGIYSIIAWWNSERSSNTRMNKDTITVSFLGTEGIFDGGNLYTGKTDSHNIFDCLGKTYLKVSSIRNGTIVLVCEATVHRQGRKLNFGRVEKIVTHYV
jgi:hypothetical protein